VSAGGRAASRSLYVATESAMLRLVLLAAAVLQPSAGFDQRYGNEAAKDAAFWAREAVRDAEFKAKQEARQRPTAIQPTALGSVTTYRLGCVAPEASETPKSAKGADACAAACVDDDARRSQRHFLRCPRKRNRSATLRSTSTRRIQTIQLLNTSLSMRTANMCNSASCRSILPFSKL